MTTTCHNIELNGKTYLLSDNNHLLDLESWDNQIRDFIAEQMGMDLTDDHKQVIDLIRKSFVHRKRHPIVRVVTADMAKVMGEVKGNMRYFYKLFPKGIHQAFQLSGLPMQGYCF